MTILIDVDNTINNFSKVLLDNLNKQRGTKFDYSEINSYDWFDRIYVNPWEITESRAFWQELQFAKQIKKESRDNNSAFFGELLYEILKQKEA